MSELYNFKQSVRYPKLWIKKYKKQVFFKGLWDKELIESRGHVYLEDKKTLVVAPFTKVFHRNEQGTDIDLEEECLCVRKVNGFMAAITYIPEVDDVVVSTTGSLDSDFVELARDWVNNKLRHYVYKNFGFTFLFEVCDESDPHIIKEKYGLYLLGIRSVKYFEPYFSLPCHEYSLDIIADNLNLRRPEYHVMKFKDILEKTEKCKHEGYVVYGQKSSTVLKLKSPYYSTLKSCARIGDISNVSYTKIHSEHIPFVVEVQKEANVFNTMSEQDRLTFLKKKYESFFRV